ncbi:hypothetical protein ABT288_27565 [Streptomyces sp. NPDC001093]|uniref:hypothetical protein n=1 Tax=Streptomyces sp. NPDC001093 TaxID=3154376 RepID=UPI0033315DCB
MPLATVMAAAVGPLGRLGLTGVGCVAVILMWRREQLPVRAEVLTATLCACGVEVLAVRPLRLWRFSQAGWPA